MSDFFARSYFPGMGEAVADRTVNRRIFTDAQKAGLGKTLKIHPEDPLRAAWENAATLSLYPFEITDKAKMKAGKPETRMETWGEVAERVALGNTSLVDGAEGDFVTMRKHLAQASLLMSGRHLQHGDHNQKSRNMEVFTNCSTAAASFLKFQLLLNGSGVGRAYDDSMMRVDWRKMPTVYVIIAEDYPDRDRPAIDGDGMMIAAGTPSLDALLARLDPSETITVHHVEDSREGWAKVIEVIERMAYEGRADEVVVFDFSGVRGYGSPIRGMQNRPSSGPGPVMKAVSQMAAVKLMTDIEPWEQTMWIDHYLSACVVVGGARRAARIATKTWRDPGIFRFIDIKAKEGLWSSNNSVAIDEEFRRRCIRVRDLLARFRETGQTVDLLLRGGRIDKMDAHAWAVLNAIAHAAYDHRTGEPGIVNQDRLIANDAGIEEYLDGLFAESAKYKVDAETLPLMRELAAACLGAVYSMIVNPCGEITLLMLGAYCVIADVVPFHAQDDDDAEEAFRTAVRALIRTNTMDCLYGREVKRTNRIGVGMTGFHEWAYARFGFAWKDIVNEAKSKALWLTVARFKRAVDEEARTYSETLGVTAPHTTTTFKPAGTTSKLFGLTEGAHLPSMRWFLRWVQFRNDDPLIEDYRAKGYPVRDNLKTYAGTSIVGFPTAPTICTMDGGDWVTTAAEATPQEQYRFLQLLEKYWLRGVKEDGVTPLDTDTGNQVSYTLKYDPDVVDFEHFLNTLIEGQFRIKCCSVMPQTKIDPNDTRFEYLPEEPISKERFEELMANIEGGAKEEVDFAHVDCSTGACPIDFSERSVA